MTYFLVLPFFVLWLVFATGATVATRLVPQLQPLFPYAWRISLWASVGCVLVNAILMWLWTTMPHAVAAPATGTLEKDASQLALLLVVFAGPVLGSVTGWLAGALLGIALAYRRGRRGGRQRQAPRVD